MQMKITKLLIYQIQSQSAIDKAFVLKLPISVQNEMHWRKKNEILNMKMPFKYPGFKGD